MKKRIQFIVILLLGFGWLYMSNSHYLGLNSAGNLLGFGGGLLSTTSKDQPFELTVVNSKTEATTFIDTLGIPHIYGKTPAEAAFALGYMHAKDRYFQMELLVNTVNGRLAKMIGENGVGSDWFWRSFELEKKAQQSMDKLIKEQPDLYQYLEAYTEGINHYVQHESVEDQDPMYFVWDLKPQEWKTHYIFFIQWYMSMNLAYYDDYVDRQEIIDKLPIAIREILYPEQPLNQPTIIPTNSVDMDTSLVYDKGMVKVFGQNDVNDYKGRPFNRSLGSNNWVVGRSKTKDGQLFLCNDLHLFLVAPNLLYEAHLQTPELKVYGFTIPGIPFVLSGHNDRIAWGITNGGWDVTEPYLLKMNPDNEEEYWLDGQWKELETLHYKIEVKGGTTVDASVKKSIFGPINNRESLTLGIKWHPNDVMTGISSFWKIMKANNWNDFQTALRTYDYPSQNFIYGDVDGNIGIISAGKMPVKPKGYNGGLLDGTQSRKTWDYVPFDDLPKSYNPTIDYLFSANQQPEKSNAYFSSRWFEDLYRPDRINQLLANKTDVDYEYMRQMQIDIVDKSVLDLQQILQIYQPNIGDHENWQAMATWDGKLEANDRQSLFYKAFQTAVSEQSNEIAQKLNVRKAPSFEQYMAFLLSNRELQLSEGETIDKKELVNDLVNATASIFQNNPSYSFSIPQITFLPVFDVEVHDVGGNENTINVNYGAHSVMRTVIELKADGIDSYMVNALGQTGKVDDKDLLQQLDDWKTNQLHPTQFVGQSQQLKNISSKIQFVKH